MCGAARSRDAGRWIAVVNQQMPSPSAEDGLALAGKEEGRTVIDAWAKVILTGEGR